MFPFFSHHMFSLLSSLNQPYSFRQFRSCIHRCIVGFMLLVFFENLWVKLLVPPCALLSTICCFICVSLFLLTIIKFIFELLKTVRILVTKPATMTEWTEWTPTQQTTCPSNNSPSPGFFWGAPSVCPTKDTVHQYGGHLLGSVEKIQGFLLEEFSSLPGW